MKIVKSTLSPLLLTIPNIVILYLVVKKNCKEIGVQKAHSEKLENNKLLKKWRTRYQSLAGLVSKTKPGSKSKIAEMYEYYKKEGAIIKDKYEKVKLLESNLRNGLIAQK